MNKQFWRLLITIPGAFVLLVCTFMIIMSSVILIDLVQSPPSFPTKPPPETLIGYHISPLTLSDNNLLFGAGYCLYALDIKNQTLHPVKCSEDRAFQRPVTDGKRIYAQTLVSPRSAQSFMAIELKDSSVVWDYNESSGPYFRNIILVDERIYMARREGVYALDIESGQRIWTTGHNWMDGPAPFTIYEDLLWYPIANDSIFSRDGALVGVDLTNGQTQQRINLLPDFEFDQLVYIDDQLIIGVDYKTNESDQIFAVNRAESGRLIWSRSLAPSPYNPVDQIFQRDNTIIFERNDTVYAIDLDTGQEVWSFNPEVDDVRQFTPDNEKDILNFRLFKGIGRQIDAAIYALDAVSGKMIWQYQLQLPETTLPLVNEGIVYVGNKNSLDAIELMTGRLLWQVKIDSKYNYYQERD